MQVPLPHLSLLLFTPPPSHFPHSASLRPVDGSVAPRVLTLAYKYQPYRFPSIFDDLAAFDDMHASSLSRHVRVSIFILLIRFFLLAHRNAHHDVALTIHALTLRIPQHVRV